MQHLFAWNHMIVWKMLVLDRNIFFHHTCESTCDTLPSSAANQGDNTVSVAQGGTATPGTTKQLLLLVRVFKRNIYLCLYIYIYIYTPDQLKAEITLDVRSTSFLCSLWFKNAFTFGRWCYSKHFLMLHNHTGMVVPRAYNNVQSICIKNSWSCNLLQMIIK